MGDAAVNFPLDATNRLGYLPHSRGLHLDIDQSIYACLTRLQDVISDVTGQRVEHTELLVALSKRASLTTTKRFISLSRVQVVSIGASHQNRVLANRVARWTLRAMGPDTALLYSYPLYREMAAARGLRPWSYRQYRRHAWGYESRARGADLAC